MQIADGVRARGVERSRSPPILISSGRPKFVWISLTNRGEGRGAEGLNLPKYTLPRHDQKERNARDAWLAYEDRSGETERRAREKTRQKWFFILILLALETH